MAKQAGQSLFILTRVSDLYLGCMTAVFLLWPGLGGYEQLTAQKAGAFFPLPGLYLDGMVLLRLELALVGGGPDTLGLRTEAASPFLHKKAVRTPIGLLFSFSSRVRAGIVRDGKAARSRRRG